MDKNEIDCIKESISTDQKPIISTVEKQSFSSIFLFFTKQFFKFYGIRILYSLIGLINKLIRSKGFSLNLNSILKAFFNMANLRTALFSSLMPSLYKILIKIFNNFKLFNNEKFMTFLAGFISALVGVFIEEKSQLLIFIILSIMVRCIHTAINITLIQNNINFGGKKASFLCFLLYSISRKIHF